MGPESGRPAPVGTRLSPDAQGGEEIRLFVRGEESIRITTLPPSMSLKVFGPGHLQKSHEFTSAAEFGEFLDSFGQRMLASGWTLLDVADRRQAVGGREEIRLFVRGEESIRITTHPPSMSLKVFGPGRLQKSHEFASAAEFGEFLDSLGQQMQASGWTLLDVAERRQGVARRSDQMEGRRP